MTGFSNKTLPLIVALTIMLSSFTANEDIPELNRKVIKYVDSVIGEQVETGECWDLAAMALADAGAFLDRTSKATLYDFGEMVNPRKDVIYPGDIVQFENVELQYKDGNAIVTESMSHHTAIVYEVIANGHYKLAHQNTSFSGRKVGVSEFKLENVVKGDLIFFRPIPDK